jgi:hypothetical protein
MAKGRATMSEAVILEFTGIGQTEYEAVNKALGLNSYTGEGDWPEGLLSHAGGTADSGVFVVMEVWTSRDAQGAFMHDRLGAALGAGGITAAPTVNWVPLLAYQTPGA